MQVTLSICCVYEATGDQLGCLYRHEIFDVSMVAVTSSRQHRQHRLGARARYGGPSGAVCRRQGRPVAGNPDHGAGVARHQVRVNALAPGYIETEINRHFLAGPAGEWMRQRIPQRRFGATSDLDGALLLLASDASRYMTGSVIVVDGGFLLA
jgi:hypothetical protein